MKTKRETKLKSYKLGDTIAAIATFPSPSALGVIKVSGRRSLAIIDKIFAPRKKKNMKRCNTYTMHYGWIMNIPDKKQPPSNNKDRCILDEVLVSIMKAPCSYTREDVVEISSHGGPVVVKAILEAVLKQGARLALPGEFTYRAFVRGRIDILQVQAITGIMEAKTEEALYGATHQLRGGFSSCLKEVREKIRELFLHTEGAVNFPEDISEISRRSLEKSIGEITDQLKDILKKSRKGRFLKEGAKCVICGKTNAGKSTLFNYLLNEERVIVSRRPGTTRDVIEETINIGGIPLRIYDTAGILEPKDLIARKALSKTYQIFEEADLIIFMVDSSRKFNKDDYFLARKVKDKNTIIVLNKCDLPAKVETGKVLEINKPVIKMSALRKKGLGDLEKAVCNNVYFKGIDRFSTLFLSQYQHSIISEVNEAIEEALLFTRQGHTLDFINLSLKAGLEGIDKLFGGAGSEELLEEIFGSFCIGK